MIKITDEMKIKLKNKTWRLDNLYFIKNKEGKKQLFTLNWAQKEIYDNLHSFNIILKARQLGITTFFSILFLDHCLWNKYTNAAIIADIQKNSQEIFQDKVKFAYDHLNPIVKAISPARRDNANELRFANGSVYRVSTSLRSGTVQLLHVSEFGKICRESPGKANEIISGALNTVQAGQFITIESTAEGRDGHFYNMVKGCQEKELKGEKLSQLDFKLHFLPWWREPQYTLEEANC